MLLTIYSEEMGWIGASTVILRIAALAWSDRATQKVRKREVFFTVLSLYELEKIKSIIRLDFLFVIH